MLKDPERRRIFDMTGEDNPQGNPGFHHGGGFPGGGFGGINIEDLMRGFGGFGGAGFGGGGRFHQGGHPGGQRQQQQGGRKTYTFSFGGGGPGGMRF